MATLAAVLVRHAHSPAPETAPDRRSRVLDAIAQNIAETTGRGLKLDTLAEMAGYSKFHFHRLFRERKGMTVHEFVNRCRTRRMREMLTAEASINEAAAALGFSCSATFSRWPQTAVLVFGRNGQRAPSLATAAGSVNPPYLAGIIMLCLILRGGLGRPGRHEGMRLKGGGRHARLGDSRNFGAGAVP